MATAASSGSPAPAGQRDTTGRRSLRLFAGSGQVDGGLVFVRFTAIVGLDLVRVALLPARLTLGELLVELSRVEEDERGELDRACGRVDRTAVATP